ncbi:N-acetylmuramoyl-L-alanine amidase [Caldicellulosiruptor naganoensis]|uniref:N-acetylmuramoyl-L-alanine amidase n=1 Tax=Caldicellulosiruptor naganoensis TaxID=29324 RepID=A0ABY7BDP4_9FIRM|nr:N-acetylmuramoyl-L-alanine amidase [Caldicellulosiruptor naganoensis]WAM30953.1 N-acetylmuramoyl-L-alanine amidase [Caldicellulosiruptor naganoensis]
MKKIRKGIVAVLVFSLLLISAFASTSYKLFVDGKQVGSVKILEYNKTVYLALADFFRYKGFAVSYDSKAKKVVAKKSKDIYEFYIGKTYYYYNKTKKTLLGKTFIESGKSYILGKDIASIFKYSYQEDKTKKVVKLTSKKTLTSNTQKNISLSKTLASRGDVRKTEVKTIYLSDLKYLIEGSKFILLISTSEPTTYKDYKLSNPDRIVIDILNTVDNLKNNVIQVGKGGILRIRHALNKTSTGEPFSRVVIDYDAGLIKSYRINKVDSQIKVEVDLPKIVENKTNIDSSSISGPSNNSQEINTAPLQESYSPYKIQKVNITSSEKFTVAEMDILPTVVSEIYRADESFVVLSLKGAQFNLDNGSLFQVNDGILDYYVLTNVDQNNAQVIFSTKAKIFILNKLGNKLEVVFANQYGNMKLYQRNGLVISSPFVSDINYTYDSTTNVIKIVSKSPITISNDVYSLKGTIVTSVYSVYQDDGCVITIVVDPDYTASITKGDRNIIVGFSQKPKPKSKLKIFIDPGHGGFDPGAIYTKIVNGKKVTYNEKDFNLDISLRLKNKLKNLGYEVYMSRETDKFVDLYDRTRMANNLNVDLFISIHNNAIDNPQIRGTMVLYKEKNLNSFISDKQLAQIVLDYIIREVGTQNKGIIERPNLVVLKTSNMPAILVEVAFGTNQDDLNLLLSDSFKDAVAKAIADAVEFINTTYRK